MPTVPLSAASQQAVNYALANGPGANQQNYVNAYNSIYHDISQTSGINPGTAYWFSQAGAVNQQQYNPSAAGTFIWQYTRSAAAYQGANVTTQEMQTASNNIAQATFQHLQNDGFVLNDQTDFSPQGIVQNEANAGLNYLRQVTGVNFDQSVWAGTLFARTALNDPTYASDYGINLLPGSTDINTMIAGSEAGTAAVGNLGVSQWKNNGNSQVLQDANNSLSHLDGVMLASMGVTAGAQVVVSDLVPIILDDPTGYMETVVVTAQQQNNSQTSFFDNVVDYISNLFSGESDSAHPSQSTTAAYYYDSGSAFSSYPSFAGGVYNEAAEYS